MLDLGKEMLNILQGILEDEMGEYITDLRFQLHDTLFTQRDLTPERRAKLFKTANPERNVSQREKSSWQAEQGASRIPVLSCSVDS